MKGKTWCVKFTFFSHVEIDGQFCNDNIQDEESLQDEDEYESHDIARQVLGENDNDERDNIRAFELISL